MIRFLSLVLFTLIFAKVCLANPVKKVIEPQKISKPPIEFLHFWISKGEINAMNVFKDAFIKKGGTWSDISVKNYQLMKIEHSIRESKGFPVSAMLLLGGEDITNMTQINQIQPIQKIIDGTSWQQSLQSFTLDALRINKQIMGIPIAIHNENWAWYNLKIYNELNLTLPKNWDEFIVQAPIIKKAGYSPIAVSDDYFSLRIFFSVLLAGVGGEDVYNRFFKKQDITVLDNKKFKKALSIFSKIRKYRLQKKHLHIWSDATEEVLNNFAAMQIMGDWAKAEFQIEKKILGKDFNCWPAPNANTYFLAAIDVIVFPYPQTKEEKAGQKLFIETLLDKNVQTDFNRLKGATPTIKDFNIKKLDMCTKSRLYQLKDKKNILYSPRFLMPESKLSQIRPLISKFWKNNMITTEQFIEELKKVFQ